MTMKTMMRIYWKKLGGGLKSNTTSHPEGTVILIFSVKNISECLLFNDIHVPFSSHHLCQCVPRGS